MITRHLALLPSRHPSAWLLAAQLLSLLLLPLVGGSAAGRVVLTALALAAVPLAVWVVRRSAAANWIAWALAIPSLALSALSILLDRPELVNWAAVMESALYFYAAASLIAYMLADHQVTTDELFASGATFTLLAWAFAYAFHVCQAWYPGSFTGAVEPQRPRDWLELLFLSFSTLSAVGNGDIIPIGPQARVLVMLEQAAGVGYVALVVSRLIGLSTRAAPADEAR